MAVNTTPSTARSFWPYFVVTGSLSMGYGSLFTLLAEFRDKLGFSETELGFIIAVGFLAGFIAQVGLARFADRGYVYLLVHGGVLIALLSMLSMAMTDEVWQFTAARFFLGAGTGATGPAIRRILITRDPPNMGKNLGTMGAFDIRRVRVGTGCGRASGRIHQLASSVLVHGRALLDDLHVDLSAGPVGGSYGYHQDPG